jgi:hypothetical protein
MNKKIISLTLLLIVLVSITASYAILTQPKNTTPRDSTGTIDTTTINSEVDSQLLDENQDITIGEMI